VWTLQLRHRSSDEEEEVRIEEQAAFLAAVMEAAGVTEVFVPNELLEGFRPVTIVREEDLMRDGWKFRLVTDQRVYAEAWIEEPKEIERG
jgi:hypothetical protein